MKAMLIRHAEKEPSLNYDPGLTPRGLQQAENLPKKIAHHFAKPLIWASERKRAQQTVAPLSSSMRLKTEVRMDLNERQNFESHNNFVERVRKTIKEITGQNEDIIFCTHYDWIEEALLAIPSDTDLLGMEYQRWSPGAFMRFEVQEDGIWKLLEFGKV